MAESIFLGIDTVLIAASGRGKTAPFMLPLMLEEAKGRGSLVRAVVSRRRKVIGLASQLVNVPVPSLQIKAG